MTSTPLTVKVVSPPIIPNAHFNVHVVTHRERKLEDCKRNLDEFREESEEAILQFSRTNDSRRKEIEEVMKNAQRKREMLERLEHGHKLRSYSTRKRYLRKAIDSYEADLSRLRAELETISHYHEAIQERQRQMMQEMEEEVKNAHIALLRELAR